MIKLYTDGAWRKKENAAGAGAVIVWEDKEITVVKQYLGDVTNNCAELAATKLGLNKIIQQVGIYQPVNLYSDSTYAIGILTKEWKAKANIYLVNQIKRIVEQFTLLEFHWVKGHSKDKYNKLADTLANIAIDQHLGLDEKYNPTKKKWIVRNQIY